MTEKLVQSVPPSPDDARRNEVLGALLSAAVPVSKEGVAASGVHRLVAASLYFGASALTDWKAEALKNQSYVVAKGIDAGIGALVQIARSHERNADALEAKAKEAAKEATVTP